MKFLWAIIAYLAIGMALGLGIYVGTAKGSWWLFAVVMVLYVVSFGKIGCLPKKSH